MQKSIEEVIAEIDAVTEETESEPIEGIIAAPTQHGISPINPFDSETLNEYTAMLGEIPIPLEIVPLEIVPNDSNIPSYAWSRISSVIEPIGFIEVFVQAQDITFTNGGTIRFNQSCILPLANAAIEEGETDVNFNRALPASEIIRITLSIYPQCQLKQAILVDDLLLNDLRVIQHICDYNSFFQVAIAPSNSHLPLPENSKLWMVIEPKVINRHLDGLLIKTPAN